MASRHSLKRKLGDLGVDLSSRKATENFCLIGTPLPPLEKAKDEFVPLWKQEVRDEKGRRRLHGAFTGGFSAGYFNTVGSKEGWTPSTFVSSRTDRATKREVKPEDFMDEEDLEELRESRKLVSTTEQMDLTAEASRLDGTDNDPIAATLKSAFQPPGNDSAGAKILQKMGWRFGQGIGPRVNLKERRQQDEEAFDPYTGLKHAGQSLSVAEDDEEANKHTYPRRDIPVSHVARKDNRHGLGYRSGISLNDSLGRKPAEGRTGPQISAGFGLGALNDADEDDIDVYDSTGTSRNRVAFDHLDYQGEETMVIGGRSGRATKPKPTQGERPRQFFPDGTPVVAGFTVDEEPVMEDKWFSGPEVPAGWKPNPQKIWESGPKTEDLQKPLDGARKDRSGRPDLSAQERANILGEAPLSTGTRSVFEFMSTKDKERLEHIAKGDLPTSAPTPSGPIGPRPPISVPTIDAQTAQAALRGFQPFTTNPAKQARYTAYLQSQATPDSAPPLKPLPGQGEDGFVKELDEYSKSAQLFKPISGAMASRFTSAAVVENAPKIHEGLYQPSEEELTQKEEEQKREEEANISPKAHAAKMGMYGPMTRETTTWMPAPLLCKRFGVKPPEPTVDEDYGQSSKPSFQTTSFEQEAAAAAASSAYSGGPSASSEANASAGDLPRKLENIGLGEDETQGADILTYERPSMDIFKAIFASDEEDGDSEPEKDEEDASEPTANLKQIEDTAPMDLTTFKPTFIPRDGKGKAKDGAKNKEKKEKKERKEKKEKKKKAAILSFTLEEEGEHNFGNPSKDKERPKKKRKEKEKRVEDSDDGVFVGSAAQAVNITSRPANPDPARVELSKMDVEQQAHIPKGRKRAIDFLDE